MSLFTVFTPALNAFLFSISGRNARPYMYLLTFTSMFSVLALLFGALPEVIRGDVTSTPVGSWIYSGLFEVDWTFGVDPLTFVMLFVVLTVSSLVHLYSTAYMCEDPHIPRFMSYLSLFTFFMLLLVSSENLISLFLGWEGVGLCSYLLISFWFTRAAANKAAIKAMIVNRVADFALTIGIIAAFFTFQTIEFGPLFGLAPFAADLSLVTFLLFVGAMGKSAQIGLHTWLPDAMEGPTPVSALIHAATMVTAGVFLIIRCSALFEQTPSTLLFVTFIGAATAFMAATSGLLQNDLKKIIAYSTCSQLGYMVFICGLSGYAISFFHLTNHAFFKALLFLSAGAVIHAVSNEQDLRRLGGFAQLLPYTYAMFVIGSLALMGFPFLTGFYSKDLILEVAAGQLTAPASFAYWLGLVTALFTAFYSFRLLYLAFYSSSRSPRVYLIHAHELTPNLALPLATLALGSVFFGFLARDLFIGFGTTFWGGVISTFPASQVAGEFLSVGVKLAPLAGSTVAVLTVFFLTATYHSAFNRAMYRFLSYKWYFDTVYNQLINQPLLQASYHAIFKPVDKGILELAGPTGFGALTVRVAYRTTTAQTGRVYDYAWFMFFILLSFFVGVDVIYLGVYIRTWHVRLISLPVFLFFVSKVVVPGFLGLLEEGLMTPQFSWQFMKHAWFMVSYGFGIPTICTWYFLWFINPDKVGRVAYKANRIIGDVIAELTPLTRTVQRASANGTKQGLPGVVFRIANMFWRPFPCQLLWFCFAVVTGTALLAYFALPWYFPNLVGYKQFFNAKMFITVLNTSSSSTLIVAFALPTIAFLFSLAWSIGSRDAFVLLLITSATIVLYCCVDFATLISIFGDGFWSSEESRLFRRLIKELDGLEARGIQTRDKGVFGAQWALQLINALRSFPQSPEPLVCGEKVKVCTDEECWTDITLLIGGITLWTGLALWAGASITRQMDEDKLRWAFTDLCFALIVIFVSLLALRVGDLSTLNELVVHHLEWDANFAWHWAELQELSDTLPPYEQPPEPPKPPVPPKKSEPWPSLFKLFKDWVKQQSKYYEY